MSTHGFNGSYLMPLFDLVVQSREDGYYRPLPRPEASSSLATDDAPLGEWPASGLICTSYSAGLAHVDALRRLTEAGQIDATSPWTLLRGALENFATGIWLLDAPGRTERRRRTLSLWAEDMRNRAQHEHDTGHTPDPGGASGTERRQEIRDLAVALNLPALTAPRTSLILEQAAPAAALDPVAVRASWRAASGFAHGRHWTLVRISQPRGAAKTDNGHLLALVLDENEHRKLTEHCHTMLRHFNARYFARASAR
ncbi:hypothetical protein ABZ918_10470 [Streptomyces viridosporus]|uniref:hypothetical protein n=1 Tax=Streptomyces viridosporus TaxID=67581 RepID=UPI0034470F80